MTTSERNFQEKQIADLLTRVSTFYSPEVTASVINHYGNFHSIGGWELEEMKDDLISKANDAD